MISRRGMALVAASLASLVSCREPEKTYAEQVAIGGDVAARVGSEVVPLSLVAKIAAEQKVSVRDALRLAVDDAVAAHAARSRGLDREVPGSWLLTAARARLVADRLAADARAKGMPSDDEVRELSLRYWREVDRPVAAHVQHAIVMKKKEGGDASASKTLARAIHDAVVDAPAGQPFKEAAERVPHPADLEVRVEDLPAFTDQGWLVDGPGRMSEVFTKAAFTLQKAGDTSGVVESEFGLHVIRLVELLPERRMPFEARRIAFRDEVYADRGKAALDALLASRRASTPVKILPSAELLMRSVSANAP